MRIAFVSWEYPPAYGGGIGTFIYAGAHAMANRGHTVTVITVTDQPHPVREMDGPVRVVRVRHNGVGGAEPMASLRSWQGRSESVAELLRRMIEADELDLIEFGDYRGEGFSFLTGVPKCSRPVSIVRLHTPLSVLNKYNPGNVRYRVLEEFENEALLAADRLVSPSQALVNEMRQALPDLGDVLLSPYPVDLQFLDHVPPAPLAERDEVLYVGRLEERKGVETLARAAGRFLAAAPGARIVLIGRDCPAGPRVPSLQKVILDLVPRQFHDRLDFPGAMPREALIERYLRARFCVFPSHFENFPNTCLEAMCLGRCVIGTDNSGMAEMITSGVDGIIVRAADPDDLADAMIRLHGMSPEERQRMGQAAHRRMADRYHPDVIADEMERIYGGFIADHPRKSRGVAAPPTAERPGVTFILPCYNHGRFLPEALESVRQQTYPHVECIVVDDGSTDAETLAVLRDVEAAGTRVIRQANQGLAAARNAGVLASRTPFFVPLDSDDKVAPDFVEKLISPLLADPSLGYSYSHVEFFGATSGIWACGPYDPRRLLVENLSVATAVVRRAAFDLVKGYSRDMVWGFEDWDFWLALLAVGYTGRCVPEPLFLYRKHPRGQSMLDETQKHRAEMIRAMIEHHRPLFASMLAMSMSDKDAMFFRAHMEAWQLRQGGTGPADAAQAAGTLDPAIYDTLMAQAELDYIESSGSWRRIQRIRESWWYRRLAEIRFGAGWDHVPAGESPADRLRRIKASRFYRALRFAKNNRAYLWYARRKYGSDFALPFTEHR